MTYTAKGVQTISPKEKCIPVRVRFWVRVSVRVRVGGGNFIAGNSPKSVASGANNTDFK